jgi:hypothetical protein
LEDKETTINSRCSNDFSANDCWALKQQDIEACLGTMLIFVACYCIIHLHLFIRILNNNSGLLKNEYKEIQKKNINNHKNNKNEVHD